VENRRLLAGLYLVLAVQVCQIVSVGNATHCRWMQLTLSYASRQKSLISFGCFNRKQEKGAGYWNSGWKPPRRWKQIAKILIA